MGADDGVEEFVEERTVQDGPYGFDDSHVSAFEELYFR
jgi:hypothetical protein